MKLATKIASVAKIDSSGNVYQLDRNGHAGEVVTESDLEDRAKTAKLLTAVQRDVTDLKGRAYPRKIDFEGVSLGNSGAEVSLRHAFNSKVRWSVVNWEPGLFVPPEPALYRSLWLERYWRGPSYANIAAVAANVTTGARFRVLESMKCVGVRFWWTATASTVRCKLWNDTATTLIASIDKTATGVAGVHCAFFTEAQTLSTGTDYVASIWDTAGAIVPRANPQDAMAVTAQAFHDVQLQRSDLWIAGDARPTSTTAAECYLAEPIIVPTYHEPRLAETSSTDVNTLVLASFAGGTATVRVEETL